MFFLTSEKQHIYLEELRKAWEDFRVSLRKKLPMLFLTPEEQHISIGELRKAWEDFRVYFLEKNFPCFS